MGLWSTVNGLRGQRSMLSPRFKDKGVSGQQSTVNGQRLKFKGQQSKVKGLR